MRYFYATCTGAISGYLVASIAELALYPAPIEPRQFVWTFVAGWAVSFLLCVTGEPDSGHVATRGLIVNGVEWMVFAGASFAVAVSLVKGAGAELPDASLGGEDLTFTLQSIFNFLIGAFFFVAALGVSGFRSASARRALLAPLPARPAPGRDAARSPSDPDEPFAEEDWAEPVTDDGAER